MDASHYGTLYQTLQKTTQRFPDHSAYSVPPMAGRAYHPDGWEVSYRETLAQVEKKRTIYAAAGYGLGHRVSILFEQRPEFVFHYYALNALGVSVVPINPDYRVEEIHYVVEHSESSLIVGVDSRARDLDEVVKQLGGACRHVSFDAFPDALPPAPKPARAGAPDHETEAALLYTSGTTGKPKGCILTNEYFHTFGECYLKVGGALTMQEGVERLFNPLPLHHANCLSISMPAMLMSGGCLIFPDRFHASTWWKDLVASRATVV